MRHKHTDRQTDIKRSISWSHAGDN